MSLQYVLIVGNQLFANALSFLLAEDKGILVVDRVPSLKDCSRVLESQSVDTLIIAETLMSDDYSICKLLTNFPEKTIIKANLENNQLEVITHQQFNASPKDLRMVLAGFSPR